MANYKLSNKAKSDFADIYGYGIVKFGLLQAKTYSKEIQVILQTLAINGNLGRDASEYMENLKRFPFKAHTIFYVILTNGIFVVRILNQRVDFTSKLE